MSNREKIEQALTKLAEQPDIAAYLLERDLKGDWCGSSCPVAMYLRAETGIQDVWVSRRRVDYEIPGSSFSGSVTIPLVVVDFIIDFDHGKYPELQLPEVTE